MERNYILINGVFYNSDEPVIFKDNRSFRYGDGVFETIYSKNKNIMFFDKHYSRIINALKILKIEIQDNYTKDYFLSEISKLLNKNKHFKSAKVRFSIYRHSGGNYLPINNNAQYMIESESLSKEKYILNSNGLTIGIFKEIKKNINLLSSFKNSNSLLYVLASIYASKNKFDDCLILNEFSEIIEATSSNIFLVKNKIVFTPSLESGCIHGIMREIIIELLLKNGYIVYEDCSIKEIDIIEADEIFLTNAITGIKWILAYNNRRYYCKVSKKIIDSLNLL